MTVEPETKEVRSRMWSLGKEIDFLHVERFNGDSDLTVHTECGGTAQLTREQAQSLYWWLKSVLGE